MQAYQTSGILKLYPSRKDTGRLAPLEGGTQCHISFKMGKMLAGLGHSPLDQLGMLPPVLLLRPAARGMVRGSTAYC